MHQYLPQWPDDLADWEPPNPADFVYRDALDLATYASLDALVTWRTWPEVWHLDAAGRWRCLSKGSSLDSVRSFAESPEQMLDCRLTSTGARCPDYWVVLEPRKDWHPERNEVVERDVDAFVVLRDALARFGVTLLDVVVFFEDFRWCSLHELACGTSGWQFVPVGE